MEGAWFDEVFVGAEGEGAVLVFLEGGGGKDHDRKRAEGGLAANPLQGFEAVHEWHFQIEDDGVGEVRPAGFQSVDEFCAVGAAADLEGLAGGSEAALGEKCVVVTIVRKKDVERLEHR